MATPEDLQNDQGFMSATPAAQIKYLSETDPAFKAAHPDKQAEFLAHVTKQPTGAEPYAPAKTLGEAVDVAGEHYEKGTGVRSALGRLGTMPAAMGKAAYHAFADKRTPEEEKLDKTPVLSDVALAGKRMLLDPSVEATSKIHGMASKNRAAGGNKYTTGAAEIAGEGLAAVPMVGPWALNAGERAGKGDVSGAVTEAVGMALAPEVMEEAMPGGALPGAAAKGARPFPTADAAMRTAGKGIRTLGEHAPDIGATIGGIAGAAKGSPSSAYFEMKGGQYGGKIIGKPLEKIGSRMEKIGLSPEEQAVQHLEKEFKAATKTADKAAEDYHAYDAGREQGIPAPKKILDAHEKAQQHLELLTQHLDAAKAKAAPAPEAEAPMALSPEQEATQATREPKAAAAAPVAPVTPENVKLPGQVQPETFPQEPTEAPVAPDSRMTLAGGQGIMGRQRMLTEGTPEPTAAPITPGAPEAPTGAMTPAEKPAKPGRLGTLKVAEGGKVVDTEPMLQQKLEEGLQGTAKPVATAPKNFTDVLPKHEEIKEEGTEPKKFEEALPKHEELTEPYEKELKSEKEAPEDMTKVEKVVGDHTDQELARLGKKYGVDEKDYDFSKRDEKRHRTERDQFVKDIIAKMPPEEAANISRLSDEFEKKDTTIWNEAERTQLSKSQRARAIMQEHEGGPKTISGGSGKEDLASKVNWETARLDRDVKAIELAKAEGASMLTPEGRQRAQAIKDQLKREELEDLFVKGGEMNPHSEESNVAHQKQESTILKSLADKYNKSEGREPLDHSKKIELDPDVQKATAEAYDKAKHEPNDPAVKKSYDALKADLDKQYDMAVKHGYTFDAQEKDPYGSHENLKDDALNNRHVSAWEGAAPPADHPLSEIDPKTGMTYNEKFRVIHDLFGHVTPDNDFSAKGEENAWNAHRQMFSKEAQPALATETRGQTAYTLTKGEFAEQKATILPEEFHSPGTEPKPVDIRSQVGEHNSTGGSTFNPKQGNMKGKDAFAVAGSYPELSQKIKGEDITHEQLKDYMAKPKVAEVLKNNPDASVGTWAHKGRTDIEISETPKDRDAAIALGKKNKQIAIYDLKTGEEIPISTDYKDMTPAEQDEFAKTHSVSGGSQSAKGTAKATNKIPTSQDLIKKYGESDGDVNHTAFILSDGKGVAQVGTEHPLMVGGVANLPKFINQEGAIRLRSSGIMGNRQYNFSIPTEGISPEQMAQLKDWSSYLKGGKVYIESAGIDPNKRTEYGENEYQLIGEGEATPEAIEDAVHQLTPEKALPALLPEVAEKFGTAEEKAGIAKSPAQTAKFVETMEKIPEVHEYTDIARAGAGARQWYQRSTKAFDALKEEAPDYFKEEGDRDKFLNLLAASSPRQSVAMNLRETLKTWKEYVDAGRPDGKALKTLLDANLTPATSKTPNAIKALTGQEMWPDITKNKNFKVPSFARNLRGYLDSVTNDGWMSLFAGLDPREISSAHSYHPLSIATRAAAEELGWEPAEAQAAIWSFTQALTERGEELPEEVRKHSEDFVDLLAHDPQVRQLLADLGVSHDNLDAKLKAIGEKPEISSGASSTTSRSVERLKDRIETARGIGAVPPPKSAQGQFEFREAPAQVYRMKLRDEDEGDTSFNPEEFRMKKKKS